MKKKKYWILAILVMFMVSITTPSCTSLLQALNDSAQTNNNQKKKNNDKTTPDNTNQNKTSKGKK